MINRLIGLAALLLLAACGQKTEQAMPQQQAQENCAPAEVSVEQIEIAPGLQSQMLVSGCGRAAEAGDLAEVHYTGWLFDAEAEQSRGDKFDSSVDRGTAFRFPLGAGRVIRGWDQGVVDMQVGEKRVLTIAPEMAYGARENGPIPANSTLIFEVELLGLRGPADEAAAEQ